MKKKTKQTKSYQLNCDFSAAQLLEENDQSQKEIHKLN
jgi:hypothetical protein